MSRAGWGPRASGAASLVAVGVLLAVARPASGVDPVPLTLPGAVLLALERSPELRVERLGAAVQSTLPDEARAAFDPSISASVSRGESTLPTTARQEALEVAGEGVRRAREDQASAELTQPLPTGTELTLGADTSRTRTNFSPEEYGSRLALGLTQPLFQGLRPSVNLARLRRAENLAAVGRYAFVGAMEAFLAGIEGAYWDLSFARRALDVRRQSLDASRRLLADAETLVAAGRRPAVELAAVRAEVAAREEALEDARAALDTARLDLVRRLGPGADLPWTAALEPVDEPSAAAAPGDPAPWAAQALTRRPDLLQARLELANGELEVIETRDGLLPRLDLFASYARHGRETRLGSTWRQMFEKDYEDWRVGLSVQQTLGRRAEGARARRADFQVQRAEAAVENLGLVIQSEVRRAAVELDRLRRKVELAEVTASARADETRAEQARFDAGRATAGDVLQAESRQREAELNWHRARSDARKAETEFLRVQGGLAEARGVEVL
ncbi:MAG: TolC family protein [Deferrisomatales bacterium]